MHELSVSNPTGISFKSSNGPTPQPSAVGQNSVLNKLLSQENLTPVEVNKKLDALEKLGYYNPSENTQPNAILKALLHLLKGSTQSIVKAFLDTKCDMSSLKQFEQEALVTLFVDKDNSEKLTAVLDSKDIDFIYNKSENSESVIKQLKDQINLPKEKRTALAQRIDKETEKLIQSAISKYFSSKISDEQMAAITVHVKAEMKRVKESWTSLDSWTNWGKGVIFGQDTLMKRVQTALGNLYPDSSTDGPFLTRLETKTGIRPKPLELARRGLNDPSCGLDTMNVNCSSLMLNGQTGEKIRVDDNALGVVVTRLSTQFPNATANVAADYLAECEPGITINTLMQDQSASPDNLLIQQTFINALIEAVPDQPQCPIDLQDIVTSALQAPDSLSGSYCTPSQKVVRGSRASTSTPLLTNPESVYNVLNQIINVGSSSLDEINGNIFINDMLFGSVTRNPELDQIRAPFLSYLASQFPEGVYPVGDELMAELKVFETTIQIPSIIAVPSNNQQLLSSRIAAQWDTDVTSALSGGVSGNKCVIETVGIIGIDQSGNCIVPLDGVGQSSTQTVDSIAVITNTGVQCMDVNAFVEDKCGSVGTSLTLQEFNDITLGLAEKFSEMCNFNKQSSSVNTVTPGSTTTVEEETTTSTINPNVCAQITPLLTPELVNGYSTGEKIGFIWNALSANHRVNLLQQVNEKLAAFIETDSNGGSAIKDAIQTASLTPEAATALDLQIVEYIFNLLNEKDCLPSDLVSFLFPTTESPTTTEGPTVIAGGDGGDTDIGIIIGAAVGGVLLCALLAVCCVARRRNQQRKPQPAPIEKIKKHIFKTVKSDRITKIGNGDDTPVLDFSDKAKNKAKKDRVLFTAEQPDNLALFTAYSGQKKQTQTSVYITEKVLLDYAMAKYSAIKNTHHNIEDCDVTELANLRPGYVDKYGSLQLPLTFVIPKSKHPNANAVDAESAYLEPVTETVYMKLPNDQMVKLDAHDFYVLSHHYSSLQNRKQEQDNGYDDVISVHSGAYGFEKEGSLDFMTFSETSYNAEPNTIKRKTIFDDCFIQPAPVELGVQFAKHIENLEFSPFTLNADRTLTYNAGSQSVGCEAFYFKSDGDKDDEKFVVPDEAGNYVGSSSLKNITFKNIYDYLVAKKDIALGDYPQEYTGIDYKKYFPGSTQSNEIRYVKIEQTTGKPAYVQLTLQDVVYLSMIHDDLENPFRQEPKTPELTRRVTEWGKETAFGSPVTTTTVDELRGIHTGTGVLEPNAMDFFIVDGQLGNLRGRSDTLKSRSFPNFLLYLDQESITIEDAKKQFFAGVFTKFSDKADLIELLIKASTLDEGGEGTQQSHFCSEILKAVEIVSSQARLDHIRGVEPQSPDLGHDSLFNTRSRNVGRLGLPSTPIGGVQGSKFKYSPGGTADSDQPADIVIKALMGMEKVPASKLKKLISNIRAQYDSFRQKFTVKEYDFLLNGYKFLTELTDENHMNKDLVFLEALSQDKHIKSGITTYQGIKNYFYHQIKNERLDPSTLISLMRKLDSIMDDPQAETGELIDLENADKFVTEMGNFITSTLSSNPMETALLGIHAKFRLMNDEFQANSLDLMILRINKPAQYDEVLSEVKIAWETFTKSTEREKLAIVGLKKLKQIHDQNRSMLPNPILEKSFSDLFRSLSPQKIEDNGLDGLQIKLFPKTQESILAELEPLTQRFSQLPKAQFEQAKRLIGQLPQPDSFGDHQAFSADTIRSGSVLIPLENLADVKARECVVKYIKESKDRSTDTEDVLERIKLREKFGIPVDESDKLNTGFNLARHRSKKLQETVESLSLRFNITSADAFFSKLFESFGYIKTSKLTAHEKIRLYLVARGKDYYSKKIEAFIENLTAQGFIVKDEELGFGSEFELDTTANGDFEEESVTF